jgi:hypothetical protein
MTCAKIALALPGLDCASTSTCKYLLLVLAQQYLDYNVFSSELIPPTALCTCATRSQSRGVIHRHRHM